MARGQASGGSRSTERITNGGRISDRVWNMWDMEIEADSLRAHELGGRLHMSMKNRKMLGKENYGIKRNQGNGKPFALPDPERKTGKREVCT